MTELSACIEERDELSKNHPLCWYGIPIVVQHDVRVVRRVVEETLQYFDDVFQRLAFSRQERLCVLPDLGKVIVSVALTMDSR